MGNFYDLHRRIQGAYLVIVEKRRYRQEECIVDTLKEILDIMINYRNNIYLDRRK